MEKLDSGMSDAKSRNFRRFAESDEGQILIARGERFNVAS